MPKIDILERSVKWPLKSSHVCACWLEIEDEANLLWDHNFLADKERGRTSPLDYITIILCYAAQLNGGPRVRPWLYYDV